MTKSNLPGLLMLPDRPDNSDEAFEEATNKIVNKRRVSKP